MGDSSKLRIIKNIYYLCVYSMPQYSIQHAETILKCGNIFLS